MADSTYADFLAAKAAHRWRHGPDIDPSSLHPVLHDWQRDVTAWAARTGRAAVFADCGLLHSNHVEAPRNPLRRVWNSVHSLPLADQAGQAVLLEGVRRRFQAARLDTALRAVRCVLLPPVRRTGSRRPGQPVLFARVLHGLAGDSPLGVVVREDRRPARAPHRCGSGPGPAATTGRGRSPHRRGQAQQPPVQPRGVPGTVAPHALPLRGDAR